MFEEESFAPGVGGELQMSVGKTTYEVLIPENLIGSNTCKSYMSNSQQANSLPNGFRIWKNKYETTNTNNTFSLSVTITLLRIYNV